MSTSSSTIGQTKESKDSHAIVQGQVADRISEFPWWILFLILSGVLLAYNFTTNATYNEIILILAAGIRVTVQVTLTAYVFAISIGLLTALGQMSSASFATTTGVGGYIKTAIQIFLKNVATLYVQVVRGVPIIVQIFYVALFVIPVLVIPAINWLGVTLAEFGLLSAENSMATLINREFSFTARGIVALAISYGAFSSEIFRAGIQSIEKGQIEAARALGLSWFQSFRLIILPQAIRRVLPPLGNDFIAMLKESSLVGVLGVGEITQLGRRYASASFLFAQTYNTLAFLYLSMTLMLSMLVKFIERRLRTSEGT
jgi:polar amino acid transport system permease protein